MADPSARRSTAVVRRLAAIALLLLLTACTSLPGVPVSNERASATPTWPANDVCAAIAVEEIEEITGAEATDTVAGDGECDWTIGSGDLINLRYESFGPGLEAERQSCDDEEDVRGVGDETIWCRGANVLYVREGEAGFAVQLVFIADAAEGEPRDIAVEIARLATERL